MDFRIAKFKGQFYDSIAFERTREGVIAFQELTSRTEGSENEKE